jgi:hypothetical protein
MFNGLRPVPQDELNAPACTHDVVVVRSPCLEVVQDAPGLVRATELSERARAVQLRSVIVLSRIDDGLEIPERCLVSPLVIQLKSDLHERSEQRCVEFESLFEAPAPRQQAKRREQRLDVGNGADLGVPQDLA